MNILNLPFIDYVDDNLAIQLVFLDDTMVHTVKWNKKKFDPNTGQWEEDADKEAQVEAWCKEYLGTELKDIDSALNKEFTIYSYDTFDSLWEVPAKFDPSLKGQFIQGEVEKVLETPTCIEIWFRYENELYVSRMRYEYRFGNNIYTDFTKKKKRFKDFQDKYGVTVEEAVDGAINGRIVNVLVKTFGKNTFGDIQSIVKAKK